MHGCAGDCGFGRAEDPSRRRFIAHSTLAAVGAVLAGACGDGVIGGTAPTGDAPPTLPPGGLVIAIADFPALATNGGIARVDPGGANPIAAVRLGPGDYAAFSMICPHAGYKPIGIESYGFRCPNHGARFAADGSWIGGQRTRDLRAYDVAHDAGAGTLTITSPA